MLSSGSIKCVLSVYLVIALITGVFIGLLLYEGVTDEGGVEAATTIIVDINGDGDYTSIQSAVNSASAGDTIRVYDGTYNENVTIDKTISLIGNGTTKTSVIGSGYDYFIFDVSMIS